MRFLIVTGMSGSGKSKAMDALEDIGYYCVDNVPPALLKEFANLMRTTGGDFDKIAFGVDVRSHEFYSELGNELRALEQGDVDYDVLFLDAEDSVLLSRYRETRRKHPLLDSSNGILEDAISAERTLISPIKDFAEYFLDTSHMSPAVLKEQISKLFLLKPKNGLNVMCVSYGAKNGGFNYADYCFDVRCLPNPFYIDGLKSKTGLDDEVCDFVFGNDEARIFLEKIEDLLDYTLPLCVREGKSQIVIAFCCTGGKHRSVSFARAVSEHLVKAGYNVTVNHRDINK